MSLTDVLTILIMLLSLLGSVRRGFIFSVLEMLCWAGSLFAGFLLYAQLSYFLQQYLTKGSPWSTPLAFLLLVAISRLLLEAAARYVLNRTPENAHTHPVNKLLGILPGAINGFLWIAVFSILVLLTPFSPLSGETGTQSKFSAWIIDKSRWLGNRLSPVFTGIFNELNPGNNASLSKEQSVKLPFTVKSVVPRPDLESRMLELVNLERKTRGLKPLKADPELAAAARKHSVDMFARGYFSHLTPEGKTPFERIREEQVLFFTAGENLAFAQTLAVAHQGLMKSPGHRANILRPLFGRLGIGVLDGGVYGLMITQNFRN
ncbi:MAG TPA: CvpA family protein [Pedobacter sp.]|nr:CvpA family protein [Pedobacter sp.]